MRTQDIQLVCLNLSGNIKGCAFPQCIYRGQTGYVVLNWSSSLSRFMHGLESIVVSSRCHCNLSRQILHSAYRIWISIWFQAALWGTPQCVDTCVCPHCYAFPSLEPVAFKILIKFPECKVLYHLHDCRPADLRTFRLSQHCFPPKNVSHNQPNAVGLFGTASVSKD